MFCSIPFRYFKREGINRINFTNPFVLTLYPSLFVTKLTSILSGKVIIEKDNYHHLY